MPKDPDIKSTSVKHSAKVSKQTKPSSKAKSVKQLSFKDKISKIGVKGKPKKKAVIVVVVGILAISIVTIAVFGVLVYKYKSSSRVVKIASKIIPYPVASVNGNVLWNTASYNQYLFELASIQKFYESQGQDLTTQEGKQKLDQLKTDIIIQLENNLIIQQQAQKYGIKVTNKEVQEQYDELVKNAGGVEKVKSTLDKLYGWTVADFKEKITQSVMQKKLGEKILGDESLNGPAKKQAEDIKNQISSGADFAELAKKFSADGSASSGGDLGLISKGQTVPEFEGVAFSLEPGQVSGIVKTEYGYHIIKVTGKEGEQVRVSHILIKGADLDSWLRDQRAKSRIVQYFKP
ncbi:hypothetical protein EXS66_02280 [Candidatus Saccharibacteria bacterium]|nr:hypothetical protein [Candidatus Saccharibacteria bacterium]